MIGKEKNNLQYIRDLQMLPLWQLAMKYMRVEHEGFPGRMALKDGGGDRQFPKPTVLVSGWSTHVDDVASIAVDLPRQVLHAARYENIQDESLFTGVHRRIRMLDRFLDGTYDISARRGPRDSFGAQIDRSW